MARLTPETRIVVNEILAGAKNGRKKLYAEIPDKDQRLAAVTAIYTARLNQQTRGDDVPAVRPEPETSTAIVPRLVRQQTLTAASEPVLKPLLDKGDATQLAMAILGLPAGKPRQKIFNAVISKIAELTQFPDPRNRAPKALKKLINLDDSPDLKYSRRSLARLERSDPTAREKLIQSLPATTLSLLGGCLDACSPRQAATLIRMAAGQIYTSERAMAATPDTNFGLESGMAALDSRQEFWRSTTQGRRAELGRLLDVIVQRDEEADDYGHPDFGLLEKVVANLVGDDPEHELSATVGEIVGLAGKRESARTIVGLLPATPAVARALREVDDASALGALTDWPQDD